MAKIYVATSKGLYEVPKERVSSEVDLVFEGSTLRGTEKIKADKDGVRVAIVDVMPIAEIYRIPLEDGEKLDVLKVYPNQYYPIGIGKEKGRNEIEYDVNLTSKTLNEITIKEGVPESVLIEDWKELGEEDIEYLPLSEEEKKRVLELKDKIDNLTEEEINELFSITRKVSEEFTTPREFKANFPSVYSVVRKDISKIQREEKLTEETVEKLAEKKFTLNAMMVGLDGEGNIFVFYYPERIKLRSSLEVAKQLNRDVSFRALGYISYLRTSMLNNAEVRERILKKLNEYLREVKEEDYPSVHELIEKTINAVEKKNKAKLRDAIIEAYKKKYNIIKKFIAEETIFSLEDILVKKGDKYFLRNRNTNVGTPLEDFSKTVGGAFVGIPRPIKVQGEWQIQKYYTALGLIKRKQAGKQAEKEAKLEVVSLNTDYHMKKHIYPIYKVLRALTENIEKYSPDQIKALMGNGFETFKGLDALESEFAANKSAIHYLDFVRKIKGIVEPFKFKKEITEEDKKAIRDSLLKDKAINEFFEAVKEYYSVAKYMKVIPYSAITKMAQKLKERMSEDRVNVITYRYRKAYKMLLDEIDSALDNDTAVDNAGMFAKKLRCAIEMKIPENLETRAELSLLEKEQEGKLDKGSTPKKKETTEVKKTTEQEKEKEKEATMPAPATEEKVLEGKSQEDTLEEEFTMEEDPFDIEDEMEGIKDDLDELGIDF